MPYVPPPGPVRSIVKPNAIARSGLAKNVKEGGVRELQRADGAPGLDRGRPGATVQNGHLAEVRARTERDDLPPVDADGRRPPRQNVEALPRLALRDDGLAGWEIHRAARA